MMVVMDGGGERCGCGGVMVDGGWWWCMLVMDGGS